MMEKPDLGNIDQQFFDIATPPFDLESHRLFQVISGSHAYGTNVATSDVDLRGVVFLPSNFLLGLHRCENIENQSKDLCWYSPYKFFGLCYKNNTHALEMLYAPPFAVKFVHPIFEEVIVKRQMFLSKRLAYTCMGYAWQQVKLSFVKKANNSGRQELIQKFGFDSKLIMHSFRLLRMGRDALVNGHLETYRPDRDFLLNIRNGKFTLDELVIMGKDENGKDTAVGGMLKDEMRLFDEALLKSKLPEHPPFEQIEQMLVKLQRNLLQ